MRYVYPRVAEWVTLRAHVESWWSSFILSNACPSRTMPECSQTGTCILWCLVNGDEIEGEINTRKAIIWYNGHNKCNKNNFVVVVIIIFILIVVVVVFINLQRLSCRNWRHCLRLLAAFYLATTVLLPQFHISKWFLMDRWKKVRSGQGFQAYQWHNASGNMNA